MTDGRKRNKYAKFIRDLQQPVNGFRMDSPLLNDRNLKEDFVVRKKRPLGGRGREWAHQCHKLLETMIELEDSEPFRNPIDVVKHQNYYSYVTVPMDLNKVMFNFHAGKYDNPHMFEDDILLIFDNSKRYFSDPNSLIYSQTMRLGWWFEKEFEEIIKNYDARHQYKRTKVSTSPRSPLAVSRNGAHSEASVAPMEVPPNAKSKKASNAQKESDPSPLVPTRATNQVFVKMPNGLNPTVTTYGYVSPMMIAAPVYSSPGIPTGAQDVPIPAPKSSRSDSTNSSAAKPPSPEQKSSQTDLCLECTNMWFGTCKNKPQKKLVLSDERIKVPFHTGSEEVFLVLNPTEVVRCVAHMGKTKKHTLFLFLTPTGEKRLRNFVQKHNIAQAGSRPHDSFSLLVVFMKALMPLQQSRLVHIFWNMGQKSIFGQLFSEVDQQGALKLLSNLKPKIMDKVVEKVAEVATNTGRKSLESIVSALNSCASEGRDSLPPGHIAHRRTSSISDSGLLDDIMRERRDRSSLEHLSTNGGRGDQVLGTIQHDMSSTSQSKQPSLKTEKEEEDLAIIVPSDEEDLAIIRNRSSQGKQSKVSKSLSPEDFLVLREEDPQKVVASGDDLEMTAEKINIKCPITQQVMKEPMKNNFCGHCYDREGVEQLIRSRRIKARCPVSGCSNDRTLLISDLRPDASLHNFILDNKDRW